MAYTFKHGDRPLEGVTVQRAVGRGGFGEVYYALTDSGKQIALKYLRENPEIELRGVSHVMNLKSPHLVTIYDVRNQETHEPFVLMEYISGPSLRDLLIAEPHGLGVQKAAFFLKGICKGLAYLHERGIVHRDLKPANIFYDDGYVKIGDYGLSKHMSVSKHSGQTVSVGTVHYMAPEIGSGSYTQAIDIYALGIILYEMLTGRLPYTGASMAEILMRHLRDQPDLRGVPAPFDQVIAQALAKDPQDRYQSADEMLAVVMDAAEISASVDSFDATALSRVPRSPEAHDPDRTVTSPAGRMPPPPLDVRAAGAELPERLQQKLKRFSRKLEQKAGRIEKRLGAAGLHTPHRRGGAARHPHEPRRRGVGHLMVLLAVTVGIAIVLNLIYGPTRSDPPAGVPIALAILGATMGSLLTYFRFVQREYVESDLLNRLAYASVAGLFMMPAYLIATEEIHDPHLAKVILGPLAAMVLCDWTRRIEDGRRGQVRGGAAFWPAVIGLIVALLANAENAALISAGVCAAVSLMTQSAAGLWPYPRPSRTEPDILGAHHSPLATERTPISGSPGGPPPPFTAGAAPAAPSAPDRAVADTDAFDAAARPSFVGRTAHAGMSFAGKMLFLLGLLLALGQSAFREQARTAIANDRLNVDREVAVVIENGIPPGITISLLFVGCLMLVAARRREGLAHFLRGCVGCLFVLWGAIVATFWGAPVLQSLFTNSEKFLPSGPGPWAILLIMLGTFGIGAFLLLWPRPATHGRPIVI